jgi:hypothetical protein
MKNLIHGMAFLALVAGACSAFATGGVTVGNAGDVVAQEFTQAGQDIVASLPYLAPSAMSADRQKALTTAVATTRVESKDGLSLNGAEVDALNFPAEQRIEVARQRWLSTAGDANAHLKLALHEYLWMAGVDDTAYKISNPLFPAVLTAKANFAADKGVMKCGVLVYRAKDYLNPPEGKDVPLGILEMKLGQDPQKAFPLSVNGVTVYGQIWQQGGADVYRVMLTLGAPDRAGIDDFITNDGPTGSWDLAKGTSYRFTKSSFENNQFTSTFLVALKQANLWKADPYEGITSGDTATTLQNDIRTLIKAKALTEDTVLSLGVWNTCALVK